ncbi:unnamed protein product [Nyctereutes procyonoides]|uniref:(raccoon dog) hypothetical protein n=1 Tax=Nyctereutes procyonoides TaxID=34880 RepID=A0A811YJY1_NYCPR|nr:unnamed protein product [Nyctereutes procyonoides]
MLSHFAGSGLPELHICPLTALCAPTLSSRGKSLEGCTCWVDAQAPAARRASVLGASIVVHKPTSLHNSPVATPQTLRGSALCFQPGRAPASLPPPLVSPNSSSHISPSTGIYRAPAECQGPCEDKAFSKETLARHWDPPVSGHKMVPPSPAALESARKFQNPACPFLGMSFPRSYGDLYCRSTVGLTWPI